MAVPVGGFAMTSPRSDVHVIHAACELDTLAGARLLRLIDARLQLLDRGHGTTAHILLDLTETKTATTAAIAGLTDAAHAAARRGVGLHLIGAGSLVAKLPVAARQALGRLPNYPSVEAALHALSKEATATNDERETGPIQVPLGIRLQPAGHSIVVDPSTSNEDSVVNVTELRSAPVRRARQLRAKDLRTRSRRKRRTTAQIDASHPHDLSPSTDPDLTDRM